VWIDTLKYLSARYRDKLRWDSERLTLDYIDRCALQLEKRGAPPHIWGFIDGTFVEVARPGDGQIFDQQEIYNGHKKGHGLMYQGVSTPDGLISSLLGPYEGRINDMNMLEQSGLKQKLYSVMGHLPPAERRYLYGDKGYFAGYYGVMGAVKARRGKVLGEVDWYANVFMSTYRVEVEHAFGTVRQLFRQVYAAKDLKLGLTPVAAMYEVAVLLTNCHTCFHGSQTNFYFGVLPPSLDTYLRLPGQSIE
jgi:hypothetical protein